MHPIFTVPKSFLAKGFEPRHIALILRHVIAFASEVSVSSLSFDLHTYDKKFALEDMRSFARMILRRLKKLNLIVAVDSERWVVDFLFLAQANEYPQDFRIRKQCGLWTAYQTFGADCGVVALSPQDAALFFTVLNLNVR